MSLLRRSALWGLPLMALLSLVPLRAQPTPPKLPEAIFRLWIHSYEEDTPAARVFRPSTFEFPPARGRFSFEIKKDGTFSRFDFARGDGSQEHRGSWKATGPHTFETSFPQLELKETIEIVSCDENELRLAKRVSR